MDNPKAPDDCRNWDSIDIFLFTNGQEYSPPRKYHLKAEELKWWDATLTFLARSQFGSLHSNIELYTLDGIKINTPLELMNKAAYVAVNPPDSFLPSGYEEYLLKASRSREKRLERLKSPETPEPANVETNKEQGESNFNIPKNIVNSYWKKIEDRIRNDTKMANLQPAKNNTPHKDTKNLQHFETNSNSLRNVKPELWQRKPFGNNTRNMIPSKFCSDSQRKEDACNLNKKRTPSFSKNRMKYKNHDKRLTMPPNNRNFKTSFEDNDNLKQNYQIRKFKPLENKTKIKENTDQFNIVTKSSPDNYSEKELIMLTNTEYDIKSDFLDIDRKTTLLSNNVTQTKIPQTSTNIEELKEPAKNLSRTNIAISQQSETNLFNNQAPYNTNQPRTFNINLNIHLKGDASFKTDEDSYGKYRTYTTLVKPEKASQITVDINLSRESLHFGNKSLQQEQPVESSIAKTQNEKFADNITKVLVNCKCRLLNERTSSSCKFKENDHYLIIMPTEQIDKFMPRDDLHIRRESEIQELLNSCIAVTIPSNSKIVSTENPEKINQHKNCTPQNAIYVNNFDNIMQFKSQGDVMKPILTIDLNKANYKVDNFAQTDWYNTILRAKCNEDGCYTFHLPPLHLLKHYNLL